MGYFGTGAIVNRKLSRIRIWLAELYGAATMVRSLVHDSARLLGAILKDHRRAKGINQVALAAALGKPQSFVSKVESGERRLDVFEFIVLVRALEIDANALMIELSEALRAR